MRPHRQRLLDEAQWAIEHTQLDRAARAYRQLFDASPQDLVIGLKLGELYLKMGAISEAGAHYAHLTALSLEQAPERAEPLARLALRLNPDLLNVRATLATLLRDQLQSALSLSVVDQGRCEALRRELNELLFQLASALPSQDQSVERSFLSALLSPSLSTLGLELTPIANLNASLIKAHLVSNERREALLMSLQLAQLPPAEGRAALSLLISPLLELLDSLEGPDPLLSAEEEHALRLSLTTSELYALERPSTTLDELPDELPREALIERAYLLLEPLTHRAPQEDPHAHLALARLMRAQGHKLHADSLLHTLGGSARARGELRLAEEIYERLLNARPQDEGAHEALRELRSLNRYLSEARLAYQRGAYEEALESLREALSAHPPEAEPLELLVIVAEALGDQALLSSARHAALEWWLDADHDAPPSAQATQHLVALCLALDERALALCVARPPLARALLDELSSLDPSLKATLSPLLLPSESAPAPDSAPNPMPTQEEPDRFLTLHEGLSEEKSEGSEGSEESKESDEHEEPPFTPPQKPFNLKLSLEERLTRLKIPAATTLSAPAPTPSPSLPFRPLPFPHPSASPQGAQPDQETPSFSQENEELRSARVRARKALSDEALPLSGERFTPLPISLRAPSASLRFEKQEEAREDEPCAPSHESPPQHKALSAPRSPLIDLPPLMQAFEGRTMSVPPLDEPALSSTAHDEAHTEFQLALTRLDGLISKLNPPDAERSTHQEGSEVAHSLQLEIDDPLSLFDSGASFQGALTPDHPLISDELEGVFDDEEALARDLDAQLLSSLTEPSLTPIEPPPSFFEGFELEEFEELKELEAGAQNPHLEHLEHLESPFYHLSSFALPSFPPLDQRVSALSGHPLNSAQRTLVELIEAREYELALSNLPPIKTTVSSYLEAHCLLGLGRLPDALACSEEGIEASPRERAAPLYALSAELYEHLGAPLESERCLIELLSIDPSLGRLLYKALRASP